jgi:hypothetical protein
VRDPWSRSLFRPQRISLREAQLGLYRRLKMKAMPHPPRLKERIMYIERKDQLNSDDARIGRVRFSKTGATLYYGEKTFQSLKGGYKANYYDVETGEEYWISGCKRDGSGRLYASNKPIWIDEDVRVEYWTAIRGRPDDADRKST